MTGQNPTGGQPAEGATTERSPLIGSGGGASGKYVLEVVLTAVGALFLPTPADLNTNPTTEGGVTDSVPDSATQS